MKIGVRLGWVVILIGVMCLIIVFDEPRLEAQVSPLDSNIYAMPAEQVCSPGGLSLDKVLAQGVHRPGKSQYVLCSTLGQVIEYVQYGENGVMQHRKLTERLLLADTLPPAWQLGDQLQQACAGYGELEAVSRHRRESHGSDVVAERTVPSTILSEEAWCRDGDTLRFLELKGEMPTWRVKRTWVETPPNIY